MSVSGRKASKHGLYCRPSVRFEAVNSAAKPTAAASPATDSTAEFDGLKMQREDDVLNLQLRMRSQDGSVRWQPFRFERYDPAAQDN